MATEVVENTVEKPDVPCVQVQVQDQEPEQT